MRALEKAWGRGDLDRYLRRWASTHVPEVPRGFFEYAWRACDLGCGIGKFIRVQARDHPDRAYLGIDKGKVRGGKMRARNDALRLDNLFGIHGNLIPILAGLPAACLDLVTIFYPNPWWPDKHRNKRWAYHPLLPKITALLRPGGRLIVTSNEVFYLSEFLYAIHHHPRAAHLVLEYIGAVHRERGRTHFETKFIDQGEACGELRFRKPDEPCAELARDQAARTLARPSGRGAESTAAP